jgi:ATP-dependent Zn protease
MNLRIGMQRLETLFPGLASWTILLAAVWVGLLFVGLLWTVRALKATRRPAMATTAYHATKQVQVHSPQPSVSFKDVGGLSRIKDEIQLVSDNRLRHNRSGVTRNGILLYGPQGTGKI